MRDRARIESDKRNTFIKHHFNVEHLSSEERDDLGFLGEFACSMALNQEWKSNIRGNYQTIDDYDFIVNGKRIDVKSETVPLKYAKLILAKTINDDEIYGRRLIYEGQFNLLSKYDLIAFGLFIRESMDAWFPIGYIESRLIIDNYPPTVKRPYGGNYPFSGSPVPNSKLKPFTDLINE